MTNVQDGAGKPLASIGTLFDATFAQTKRHFWTLVWLMLLPGVVLTFAQLYLDPQSIAYGRDFATNVTFGVVLLIIGILWSLAAYAATIRVLTHADKQLAAIAAYKSSSQFILPILGVSLLTVLAVLGGVVLLIIPGLVFALWYSFAPYVVVNEKASVLDAMRRSRHYVAGRFWSVVGRILIMGLATFAVSLLLSMVLAGVSIGLGETAGLWLGIVLSIVLLTPIQIAATVFHYQLYQDLRATR